MIIACEPVCRGFVHATVNSALLSVLAEAFPHEGLCFLAEEEHLALVTEGLPQENRSRVGFKQLALHSHKASMAKRFAHELGMVAGLFENAEKDAASFVIFTCISEVTLRAIKQQLKQFPTVRCVVVLHGILASVMKRPSLFPWKNRHTFRTCFLQDNSRQLTYLVPGESIEREVVSRFPSLQPYLISIDMPYRFAAEEEHTPFVNHTVSFGALGVLRKVKGSHEFFRLAREVRKQESAYQPRFVCVGPIVDKKLRRLLSDDVSMPSPDAPLPPELFARHVRQLDYAVFLHSSETYTFGVSGVLLDAFSYLKPIIALKNSCMSYYFQRLGNIGYLCEDYAELKQVVLRLLENPPYEEYRSQLNQLRNGRETMTIAALATMLRNKMEERMKC